VALEARQNEICALVPVPGDDPWVDIRLPELTGEWDPCTEAEVGDVIVTRKQKQLV
jgi:hypothetical protein